MIGYKHRRETKSPNTPSHEIFHVTGDGDKARWHKIGAAWYHEDREGLNLTINYMPLGEGRMVMRIVKPKANNDE